MKYIAFLLLFALVVLACRSQKLDPEQYDKPIIFFGSGGGFTGMTKDYCITTDGDLYNKTSIDGEWQRIAKGKEEEAKPYFDMIESMNFGSLEINNPGNHYRYLGYETSSNSHRVTWGRNPDDVPEDLKQLYKMLNQLVKNNRKDNNK